MVPIHHHVDLDCTSLEKVLDGTMIRLMPPFFIPTIPLSSPGRMVLSPRVKRRGVPSPNPFGSFVLVS